MTVQILLTWTFSLLLLGSLERTRYQTCAQGYGVPQSNARDTSSSNSESQNQYPSPKTSRQGENDEKGPNIYKSPKESKGGQQSSQPSEYDVGRKDNFPQPSFGGWFQQPNGYNPQNQSTSNADGGPQKGQRRGSNSNDQNTGLSGLKAFKYTKSVAEYQEFRPVPDLSNKPNYNNKPPVSSSVNQQRPSKSSYPNPNQPDAFESAAPLNKYGNQAESTVDTKATSETTSVTVSQKNGTTMNESMRHLYFTTSTLMPAHLYFTTSNASTQHLYIITSTNSDVGSTRANQYPSDKDNQLPAGPSSTVNTPYKPYNGDSSPGIRPYSTNRNIDEQQQTYSGDKQQQPYSDKQQQSFTDKQQESYTDKQTPYNDKQTEVRLSTPYHPDLGYPFYGDGKFWYFKVPVGQLSNFKLPVNDLSTNYKPFVNGDSEASKEVSTQPTQTYNSNGGYKYRKRN